MPMKKAGRQGKQLRKTEGEWEWLKNYRVWDANRRTGPNVLREMVASAFAAR
jgi:hypothetical protein